MSTIEKMREVADLLVSQRKYREAYTIYDELYRQIWSIFVQVQINNMKLPRNLFTNTITKDLSYRKLYVEAIANLLCLRIYNINLPLFLDEFVRIICGRLNCLCHSLQISKEATIDVVLCEFTVLYTMILQPKRQRRITPIFEVVTAITDGNNRFRKIRSNYPRWMVERLLVESANKNRVGDWMVINQLLRDYLFSIGEFKSTLYTEISNIMGQYSYSSYYKYYNYNWYRNNERNERYNKYQRYEDQKAYTTNQFHQATATDEEKMAYYGRLIGLMGKVTKAQIRSKYINMISLYHPDKVQHLGPELRELAEMKTKEINAAYDWLKSKYNI
jgi:hypothetical protein